MLTPRFVPTLALLAIVLSFDVVSSAQAATVTTAAQAGYQPSTTENDGSSASSSDSFDAGGGKEGRSTAFASPAGLSVFATSTGWAPTHVHYGAGASFSVVEDTTFNYQPDFLGGQDDWVQVGLTGALSGTIVGERQGGTGSARARVTVSGNIWSAPPDEGGTFRGSVTADTGDRGGSVRAFDESQTIDINEFVSTGYFWVPRGEAITFSASLSVQVFSDHNSFGNEPSHHGMVTANFADTFAFDPYRFFDILTPGITANSPALGLVDNQLVSVIPLPAPVFLLGSVMAVYVLRRSKAG